MTNTWLAYIPSPPRGVWHLGPVPIRAYAFFIITGIVVALLIGDRRFAARGGERGVIYDIALWVVPFGLVGGRLYHLATDWQTYWGPNGAGLGAALRIWDGGLGIWGAVALGVVGAWIGCRRRGIPLPAFIDAVAPGVVLAQAIGRLGNYFNQELYGRETTVPWGLEIFYRRDPGGFVDVHSLDGTSTGQVAFVVQPTFLYELLWNLLVFGVLLYLDRRFTLGHGRLFASYVALYCVGRFGVELLRDDTATHIAGIRVNTFTSTFVFVAAVVYIILAPKGREDPATLRPDDADAEEVPADGLATVASASAATTTGTTAASHDDEPADAAETVQVVEIAEPETEQAPIAGSDAAADETAAVETVQAAVTEPDVGETEVESVADEPEVAVADPEDAEIEEPAVESVADEAEVAAVAEPEGSVSKPKEAETEEPEGSVSTTKEAETEEPEAEVVIEVPVVEPEDAETEEPAEESVAEESEVVAVAEPEAVEEPEGEVSKAEQAETEEPAGEAVTEAAVVEPEDADVEEPAAEAPEVEEVVEPESELADVVEALETEEPESQESEPGETVDSEAESEDVLNTPPGSQEPTEDESRPALTTEGDEPAERESADDDEKAPTAAQEAPETSAAARKRLRFRLRRQRS
jgi:prolipoprotein diacylglyceryl transferase